MMGFQAWRDTSRSEAVSGDWARVERRESFPVTLEGNLLVPLFGGLALGVASVLVVSGLALASEASARVFVSLVFITWGLVWGVGMFILLGADLSNVRRVEFYEGQASLSESEALSKVRLEVVNPQGARFSFGELPVSEDAFRQFAGAVVRGKDLSLGAWTGSRGIFSRSEYDALTDFLMRAGLVRWCNPQAHSQGRELTAAGKATLARFVEGETRVLEG